MEVDFVVKSIDFLVNIEDPLEVDMITDVGGIEDRMVADRSLEGTVVVDMSIVVVEVMDIADKDCYNLRGYLVSH